MSAISKDSTNITRYIPSCVKGSKPAALLPCLFWTDEAVVVRSEEAPKCGKVVNSLRNQRRNNARD
jgi:hypothetical protein